MTFHNIKSNISNLKFTSKQDSGGAIITTISVDANLNPYQIGTLAALQEIGHLELGIESSQSTMEFDVNTGKPGQGDNPKNGEPFGLPEGSVETAEETKSTKKGGKE